MQFITLFELLA